MSNKTEAPTPKRIRRARQDGEIAKSTHLTVAFSGLCWWLYLFIEAPRLYALGTRLMLHMTTLDATLAFGDRLASTLGALSAFMPAVLTALGVGALAVLVPELVQTRGLLAWKRVTPDVKRLNPVNGLKQMFSLRLVWDIVLTLLQFAILLFLFAQALAAWLRQLAPIWVFSLPVHLGYTAISHSHLLAWMAASQIVPGAADYFIQRFLWLRGLRMDKSEIKREFRDDEGDPYVKNRRRTLHRELGQ
ncbi:Yop proteins translocation protein U [Paraburkholderia domus]|jgi:Flagellar biosynthesis pathway, component FlhB|uniref:Yop proteins translocation protein U n=1 Tax=Paraburkholderia domus TaxID=2793075 RepID=A0A9N8N881_9BURK|nr:EscU/YscU/HrcU family type III secretion system export apparatus switch protein [Paraburkholderia domus]MBK5054165.1 EscU/YscU/HrcU family type III secretion system export apparatus switch protein [Burkholderia sp. R-70006]MBK5064193.1 EscU/YscU/HrcU family type III secretion system export apparatus switch protein [Burkholderia sp. R-70199]MBK5091191.1 EscU/YscU/HrcU family type III secretion system export apparatus switch protein [Burkholderia sp. R-69927]MBK5125505.1 EscU/YscU/HrcU family 